MTNVQSLDRMLEGQCRELDSLTIATTLLQNRKNVMDELENIHQKVTLMKKNLDAMWNDLVKLKQQNTVCQEMLLMLEKLKQKITHMQENIPSKLVQDYINVKKYESPLIPPQRQFKSSSNNVIDETYEDNKENEIKDCKKVLFTKSELYPSIDLLTQKEFSNIPKYIIGRQSLETINGLIRIINQVLKAKYTLLSSGKHVARKKGELELYLNYKKQQTIVTEKEGEIYFFTAEDYERYAKAKLDKTKLNLITALRNCKRLREIRTAKSIQYVAITNTHNV